MRGTCLDFGRKQIKKMDHVPTEQAPVSHNGGGTGQPQRKRLVTGRLALNGAGSTAAIGIKIPRSLKMMG